MVVFTTKLNGRKGQQIEPTPTEAEAMLQLGFRFEIYSPERQQVRLSRPCNLMIAPDRDELTFEQQ